MEIGVCENTRVSSSKYDWSTVFKDVQCFRDDFLAIIDTIYEKIPAFRRLLMKTTGT